MDAVHTTNFYYSHNTMLGFVKSTLSLLALLYSWSHYICANTVAGFSHPCLSKHTTLIKNQLKRRMLR